MHPSSSQVVRAEQTAFFGMDHSDSLDLEASGSWKALFFGADRANCAPDVF